MCHWISIYMANNQNHPQNLIWFPWWRLHEWYNPAFLCVFKRYYGTKSVISLSSFISNLGQSYQYILYLKYPVPILLSLKWLTCRVFDKGKQSYVTRSANPILSAARSNQTICVVILYQDKKGWIRKQEGSRRQCRYDPKILLYLKHCVLLLLTTAPACYSCTNGRLPAKSTHIRKVWNTRFSTKLFFWDFWLSVSLSLSVFIVSRFKYHWYICIHHV